MKKEVPTSVASSAEWITFSGLQLFAFQPGPWPQGETKAAIDATFQVTPSGIDPFCLDQGRWEEAAAEAFWRLEG